MEHSNTISDKCITSAEFAAIAPVLGRINTTLRSDHSPRLMNVTCSISLRSFSLI